MSSRWLIVAAAAAAWGGSLAGCARDPLGASCPAVAPGDLVVTEIRGDQSGSDGYGEWIEIYNASAGAVDLRGLEVHLLRVDGGAEGSILVRQSVTVEAGAYAVIGRFFAGEEPDHVDYGYKLACEDSSSGCDEHWFDTTIYDGAAVDLIACGEQIDRAIYRNLPGQGTWGFDGAITPDAGANDEEDDWCADEREDMMSDQLGIRGTPGEENMTCS